LIIHLIFIGMFKFLIIALLIAYIVWRVRASWTGAQEVAEIQDDSMHAWKAGFAAFQKDQRFQKLTQHIGSLFPFTLDEPTDGTTYKLVYMVPMDKNGQSLAFDEIDQADFLITYLKNASDRVQVSLDLHTGAFQKQSLGSVAFSTVVPGWAR
jgi:hypothetical protein